ncbi:MAG: hypothetical protein Q8882_00100 [Bacillota bacterium]|nr:hypothetical protein [Bacillota bacterium]
MTKTKLIFLLVIIIVVGATVSGCENANDVKVSENYARYYFIPKGEIYSVEKTVYDAKIDRYIVYLKGDKDETEKKVIIKITDGKVSGIDIGDGNGEVKVQEGHPKVTEDPPGNKIIDFN